MMQIRMETQWQLSWVFMLLGCVLPSLALEFDTSVCPIQSSQVTLREEQSLFFHPVNDFTTYIKISSKTCVLNQTLDLKKMGNLSTNANTAFGTDRQDRLWYLLQFILNDDLFFIEFIGNISTVWYTTVGIHNCSNVTELNFEFIPSAELAGNCTDMPNIFFNDILPSWMSDNTYVPYQTTSYRYSGHSYIYVPIGSIILMLIICLRCCTYYCHKRERHVSVVRIVRAVEVTAAEHGGSRYGQEDFPQSYADVENQVPPPPPYAEVQKLDTAEAAELPPPYTETAEGATHSSSSRLTQVLTRQKPFSFVPLREEE